MVSQQDCTTFAIITGIVFLSGVGGYMYMEKCQNGAKCEEEEKHKKQNSLPKVPPNKNERVNTGSIELDNLINKIRKFNLFSPRTIPEIQKHIKIIHQILNRVNIAKEEDEINYVKELKTAESSHHALLNEFSKLELEIPDDDGAKKIFKVNSEKIKKLVKTYIDQIKSKVEENK